MVRETGQRLHRCPRRPSGEGRGKLEESGYSVRSWVQRRRWAWGWRWKSPRGDPRGSVYGRGTERSKANSKGGRVARLGRPKTRTGSRRRNTQPPVAFGTHGAKQQLPSPLRVRRGRAPSAPRVASASPPRHLSTTATHLTPAARSGTAPPRWAGKGAGAGTQRGPASAASGLDSGDILPLYGQ